MRIAVVEPSARGGLIHYAYMLCRELAREGGGEVDVTLITGRSYELAEMPHELRVEPILRLWDPKPPARTAGPESSGSAGGLLGDLLRNLLRSGRRAGRAVIWYREWVRLAFRLRRLAPDVVQLGDVRFPGDLAGLWLLRALGLRLADVCHNVEPFAGGRFGRRGARGRIVRSIYRRIYRCFDVVFVHYRTNRRTFLRHYDLSPSRVHAIPLGHGGLFRELRDRADREGASGPAGSSALRQRLGLPEAAPVVLLFGTLSPYKGTDLLLEAFALLREAHPEARLVLAGHPLDGFAPAAYRERARELGLGGDAQPEADPEPDPEPDPGSDSEAGTVVTVVPEYLRSEEVAGWMELAAVAVFPYREIYQSAALQVALTFGVPTVASRVGAMPEMVRDGETGLLVPPDDAPALAAALDRLLSRPELARELGEAAAADQLRRSSWGLVARRMLDAYRALPAEAAEAAESAARGEGVQR